MTKIIPTQVVRLKLVLHLAELSLFSKKSESRKSQLLAAQRKRFVLFISIYKIPVMLETSSVRSIFIHGSSELSALLIFY
jgi:hypothetical protein